MGLAGLVHTTGVLKAMGLSRTSVNTFHICTMDNVFRIFFSYFSKRNWEWISLGSHCYHSRYYSVLRLVSGGMKFNLKILMQFSNLIPPQSLTFVYETLSHSKVSSVKHPPVCQFARKLLYGPKILEKIFC